MAKKRKHRRKVRWGRVATLVAVVAALIACVVGHPIDSFRKYLAQKEGEGAPAATDSVMRHALLVDALFERPRSGLAELDGKGQPVKHRIVSVSSYAKAFPDLNDVQLATASRLGLKHSIADREEADSLKDELVYIGASPYFDLRPMNFSIPYLVPRAYRLLNEIARNFQDSLVRKGLPMHKMCISSVLRTESDVKRLRRGNANASDQSCHRYGTTFDISYNYYTRVQDPDSTQLPEHWGVQLKQVLAEVLRDQREAGTCYVKYEVHKPCFHVTCR